MPIRWQLFPPPHPTPLALLGFRGSLVRAVFLCHPEIGQYAPAFVRHYMVCWILGCTLNVFSLPPRWLRNQFPENTGRRSCGSLHAPVYYFTLEKFFTLFKPRHEKKKKRIQWVPRARSSSHALSGVFVTAAHTKLYNAKGFYGMRTNVAERALQKPVINP